MATITPTKMTGIEDRTINETTLGASDTLEFNASKDQILILRNETAGALTPNIDGDGATTVQVKGIGEVDVSAGFDFASVAAGEVVALPLNTISHYLSGTIALTGADGMVAQLLEFA